MGKVVSLIENFFDLRSEEIGNKALIYLYSFIDLGSEHKNLF